MTKLTSNEKALAAIGDDLDCVSRRISALIQEAGARLDVDSAGQLIAASHVVYRLHDYLLGDASMRYLAAANLSVTAEVLEEVTPPAYNDDVPLGV